MPTDIELDRTITEELRWDPRVEGLEIGVTVRNAVATLTGTVQSHAARAAAGTAALRIHGVRAVANELLVKPAGAYARSDTKICKAIIQMVRWHSEIPSNRIRVLVKDGWVFLIGDVDQHHQRMAAEELVRRLVGVKGVTNNLKITNFVTPLIETQQRIEAAIVRSIGEEDARSVVVEVNDKTVTLSGFVRSWDEFQHVDKAAWNAPGVTTVNNRLLIGVTLLTESSSSYRGIDHEL